MKPHASARLVSITYRWDDGPVLDRSAHQARAITSEPQPRHPSPSLPGLKLPGGTGNCYPLQFYPPSPRPNPAGPGPLPSTGPLGPSPYYGRLAPGIGIGGRTPCAAPPKPGPRGGARGAPGGPPGGTTGWPTGGPRGCCCPPHGGRDKGGYGPPLPGGPDGGPVPGGTGPGIAGGGWLASGGLGRPPGVRGCGGGGMLPGGGVMASEGPRGGGGRTEDDGGRGPLRNAQMSA